MVRQAKQAARSNASQVHTVLHTADLVLLLLLLLPDCRADTAAKGDERAAKLPDVVAAANDVITAINATELAAFLAMRGPADSEGADGSNGGSNGGGGSGSSGGSSAAHVYKETKAEKDKEKAALLEALKTKLKAQLDLAEVRVSVCESVCVFLGEC